MGTFFWMVCLRLSQQGSGRRVATALDRSNLTQAFYDEQAYHTGLSLLRRQNPARRVGSGWVSCAQVRYTPQRWSKMFLIVVFSTVSHAASYLSQDPVLKAFEPRNGALGRFAALGLNSFPLLILQVRR